MMEEEEEEYIRDRYNPNAIAPEIDDDEDDDDDDDDDDDEEETPLQREEEERQHVFLIVGQSGQGKTTLSKELIKSIAPKGRKVLLLNDNTGGKPPRGWKRIDWKQLDTAKDACVVVEDVVSTSKQDFEALKTTIHFSNHHRKLNPVIIIAHTISRNNLFTLLPGFRRIYVSAAASSVHSLRILLRYFGYEKTEQQAYVQMLRSIKERYHHLVIDLETSKIRMMKAGDKEEKPQQQQQKTTTGGVDRYTMERFMALLPNPDIARATCDLVLSKIDPSLLDPTTLTVSLFTRGRRVYISLVDFIETIGRDVKEDEEAGADEALMRKFHRYLLARQCRIPQYFIRNRRFKSTAESADGGASDRRRKKKPVS